MMLIPERAALRGWMRLLVRGVGVVLILAGGFLVLAWREAGAPSLVGGVVLLVGGLHLTSSACRGRWPTVGRPAIHGLRLTLSMIRLTQLFAFALALALPRSVQAQDSLDLILPGTRVRVTVPELGIKTQIRKLTANRGCIHVRVPTGGRGTILGVPLHRVTRLEIAPSDAALLLGARERVISFKRSGSLWI